MNKKFIYIFFSEDTFLSVFRKRKAQKVSKENKSVYLSLKRNTKVFFLSTK